MNNEQCGIVSSSLPSHFHHFSKFPPEIRWMIWQMAICTDRTPRIHYYSLFNDDVEGDRQTFLPLMLLGKPTIDEEPCIQRHKNGTPMWARYPKLYSRPAKSQSWTKANRFLHYWDAGLRSACIESRAVLLQHVSPHTRKPTQSAVASSSAHKTVIATYERDQHVRVDICSRDITCLRFAPEDMAICSTLRWDILLTRLPFLRLPRCPRINLAFEFQDSWDDGLECTRSSILKHIREPSHRGLVMRICWAWRATYIPRWTRVWLIDRGGRLPANYNISKRDDFRYSGDLTYSEEDPPDRNMIEDKYFIDGKTKYVECYMWDHAFEEYRFDRRRCDGARSDVPISRFTWKLSLLCGPENFQSGNKPIPTEGLFRVLRPLPGTEGTG